MSSHSKIHQKDMQEKKAGKLWRSRFETAYATSCLAEGSRAEKRSRHTSRASKASRTTAKESSTRCIRAAKATGICGRTKSCSCTEQTKIRVSDGFALISKVPKTRVPWGGVHSKDKRESHVPVFVFVFAPKPPKPVFCCCG